jgi:hypothetical protein
MVTIRLEEVDDPPWVTRPSSGIDTGKAAPPPVAIGGAVARDASEWYEGRGFAGSGCGCRQRSWRR